MTVSFPPAAPVMARPDQVMFAGRAPKGLSPKVVAEAFERQSLKLTPQQARAIQSKVAKAAELVRQYPQGNSQVDMAAVNIASALGLNAMTDASVKQRIEKAVKELAQTTRPVGRPDQTQPVRPPVNLAWDEYFRKTVDMTANRDFLALTAKKGFSPVKISWEDIGRYKGSVWGSRISDVGIWVRKDEKDPQSAELALSVRRDNNFRDKVLVVPAKNIKVHLKENGKTQEVTLPQRLKELGLTSKDNDDNVIVSSQFAIVPVPSKDMRGVTPDGKPPRSAFTFSIQPYGSKNLVITDVIEGSSNAVVDGRRHQLLYANIDGSKAPFTASRAEDRQDLLKLEKELKAKGMDVDVQRYYLIQVPLKNDAPIRAANLGEPPFKNQSLGLLSATSFALESLGPTRSVRRGGAAGLGKVAIGHGEKEGDYSEGSGYRGQRAEEPIRVTVVYFVTPKGEVTQKDMDAFAKTFEKLDKQALWGGSFVVPDDKSK